MKKRRVQAREQAREPPPLSRDVVSFFLKHNTVEVRPFSPGTRALWTQWAQQLQLVTEELSASTVPRVWHAITATEAETEGFSSLPDRAQEAVRRDLTQYRRLSYAWPGRLVELVVGVSTEAEATPAALDDIATHVLLWVGFLHRFHSFRPCSERLRVYLYLTDFAKVLPKEPGQVLDQEHVNTAFTRSCQRENEIVLFRREEWFKVLMHESFHSFGLDFSEITEEVQRTCNRHILSMFPVASEVNLYEAYTEYWAEMLHSFFQSFLYAGTGTRTGTRTGTGTRHVSDMLEYGELVVHVERLYSVFQLVKVLHYMGLRYEDLVASPGSHITEKHRRYRENTNVLAYYVLKNIMLHDYNDFLGWCRVHHRPSLMQFRVTSAHIEAFCGYLRKHYRSASLLEDVACTETLWQAMAERSFWREAGVSAARERWVRTNLRMTLTGATWVGKN